MSDSSDNPVTHEIDESLLEEIEFEEVEEMDLLRTVEMGVPDMSTRPMPVLQESTRPMEVPRELMKRARPTMEGEALPREMAFEAVVGADGVVTIPAEWRALLAHREVEIVVKLKD